MLGLTAIEPQLGFNWALPCQLTLQGGEGVLERLADKPSLPIGDRRGPRRSVVSPGR